MVLIIEKPIIGGQGESDMNATARNHDLFMQNNLREYCCVRTSTSEAPSTRPQQIIHGAL